MQDPAALMRGMTSTLVVTPNHKISAERWRQSSGPHMPSANHIASPKSRRRARKAKSQRIKAAKARNGGAVDLMHCTGLRAGYSDHDYTDSFITWCLSRCDVMHGKVMII